MTSPLVIRSEEAPAPLHVLGEEITVLAPAAHTGSFEIFRQVGPADVGPPPHSHAWDEAFYVLGGEVVFGVGDDPEHAVGPGTFVHVPGACEHWFRFGPGGGEMISVTSRAGASELFSQIDREVSHTEPDLPSVVGIALAHGLTIAAPPVPH